MTKMLDCKYLDLLKEWNNLFNINSNSVEITNLIHFSKKSNADVMKGNVMETGYQITMISVRGSIS